MVSFPTAKIVQFCKSIYQYLIQFYAKYSPTHQFDLFLSPIVKRTAGIDHGLEVDTAQVNAADGALLRCAVVDT